MSVFTLAEPVPDTASYGTHDVGPIFASVLVGARAGADWAWTLLYRSLAPRVLAYLRANGIATADAALGDVFARAAEQLDDFDGDARAFQVWMFTIAHELVEAERGRDDAPTVMAGQHVPAEARLAAEILKPEQRDVILLASVGGQSPLEIASVLDRPLSAVRSLERKAHDQLRIGLPLTGADTLRRHHGQTDVRDDTLDRFLERLEHLSANPASLEEAQVAAAVRVVTAPSPAPRRVHRVYGHRRLPRRLPALSLSAMTALFAGLPAKAAFAAAAAVAATAGLAASDNLPDAAVSALQAAAENVGFTVEEQPDEDLPASGRFRSVPADDAAAARGDRGADPVAAKAAGLEKAAAAPGSARAGEHKAAGLANAAAGAANADGHAAAGSGNAAQGADGADGGRRADPPKPREQDDARMMGPKAQQHEPRSLGRGGRVAVPAMQEPQRAEVPGRALRALTKSVEDL